MQLQELIPLNPIQRSTTIAKYGRTLDEKKAFKVQTFEERFKIPKCAYISTDEEDYVFYSCTCTDDESALVCQECVKICHTGPGHLTSRFDKLEGSPMCNCGDNNHEMKQKPNYEQITALSDECFFKNLLRANVPRFGIQNKDSSKNYHCFFCEKFNNLGQDSKESVFPVTWQEFSHFDCKVQQKTGRIQLTIKFMQQLFGMNENIEKGDYDKFFIRKYLMDINYNALQVLGIDQIFEKDIILNDIAKFFQENKNEKGEFELITPIIFSNSFFIYVQKSFIATQLLKNSRFTIPFNFFKTLPKDKLERIMLVSKDLVMYDDDKSDLFPQLIENMANGFFIFYNTFYHYIMSFYMKYKLLFRTLTITNLTLFQRSFFLIESKSNISKLGTKAEQDDFSYWLNVIPNGLIDFMERIQSFKIHEKADFIPGLNSSTFLFFKVFKFFIKFNLIDEFTTVRFLKVVSQIFDKNLNVINYLQSMKTSDKKGKDATAEEEDDPDKTMFIKLPKFDHIIEIIFLSLLYHNDKLCLKMMKGEDYGKKLFVFINDNNNDLIYYSLKLFVQALKFINYIKASEHTNVPNKLIYEQSFNKNVLKNLYDSHKINYLIKQVFELIIESKPKYNYEMKMDSYSYLLGIDNIENLTGNPYKCYIDKLPIEDPMVEEINSLYAELIRINAGYFSYSLTISDYIAQFSTWTNNLIKFLYSVVDQSQFNNCLSSTNIPPEVTNPRTKLFHRFFKTHPFFQKFEEFLYIYTKSKKFFRQDILSKEQRSLLLKFVLTLIQNNFDNILLFMNVKAKYFVMTLYTLGEEYFNFIQIFSEMLFNEDKFFKMDNYFFMCDLIRYTAYKLPLDTFAETVDQDDIEAEELMDDLGFVEQNDLVYYEGIYGFQLSHSLVKQKGYTRSYDLSNIKDAMNHDIKMKIDDAIIDEAKNSGKESEIHGDSDKTSNAEFVSSKLSKVDVPLDSTIAPIYPISDFSPNQTLRYFGVILKLFRKALSSFTFENIEFTEVIQLVVKKIDLIEKKEKIFCDYFTQDVNNFKFNADIEDFILNYCKFFNEIYDKDLFFFGFLTSKDDKILENVNPLKNNYLDLEKNVLLKLEIYQLYLNEESKNNFFVIGKDYAQVIMDKINEMTKHQTDARAEDIEAT